MQVVYRNYAELDVPQFEGLQPFRDFWQTMFFLYTGGSEHAALLPCAMCVCMHAKLLGLQMRPCIHQPCLWSTSDQAASQPIAMSLPQCCDTPMLAVCAPTSTSHAS
jgi:hypothetical protein